MGGNGVSQMGNHSAVCLSVCWSVSQSVSQSVSRNQSVGKQSVRKEERNVFGQLVRFVMSEKEGSRSLYKYRKAR